MTRWLSRLAAVVLSVGIGLVMVEAALRLVWIRRATVASGLEHPQFHHRQKPETTYHYKTREFDVRIRTNRYGLRGPDPVLPKPAGVTRVLMLGDSYTFGFPVRDAETFAHLIEAGLRAEGSRLEVVNGGVSGYSPTLHYVSLRDQFLSFEPDLVVLWLDLGDVQEDHRFQKNLLYDEAGTILRCDPRYVHGRLDAWEWWRNHSAIAKYLDTKLIRTLGKIRTLGLWGYVQVKWRGERAKVAIARLKEAQEAADLGEHDRFLLVRDSATDAGLSTAWALTARYLHMIHALLEERQIPLVLGIYPYGMLVGPDQWAEGRVYWGFEKGRTYDDRRVREWLHRFATTEGLPLIDTFDSFRAAATTETLFYDWDGHFTPAGHRVLAEAALEDPTFQRVVGDVVRTAQSAEDR